MLKNKKTMLKSNGMIPLRKKTIPWQEQLIPRGVGMISQVVPVIGLYVNLVISFRLIIQNNRSAFKRFSLNKSKDASFIEVFK